MFKVDNKNTRRTSHLCQGLFFNKFAFLKAATLLEKRVWHRCDVVLVFFLLTLNIFHTCFHCFYCWLWITKSSLGHYLLSSFIFHNMVEADLKVHALYETGWRILALFTFAKCSFTYVRLGLQGIWDRSSYRRCSVKKAFFKILQNSQVNTCARVSFLIKSQG